MTPRPLVVFVLLSVVVACSAPPTTTDAGTPVVDTGLCPTSDSAAFELTETRCDGLDNDCDGRVDAMAPVLLDARSTPSTSLTNWYHPEFIRTLQGLVLYDRVPRFYFVDDHGRPTRPPVEIKGPQPFPSQWIPRASIVGGNLTLLQGSFAFDGGATVYRVTLTDDAGSPQLALQSEWTHPDAYVAFAYLNVANFDGTRALHAYDVDIPSRGRPYAGVVRADGTFDVAVGEHALPNGQRYLSTARPMSTGFQIAGTDYGTTERIIRLATVDSQLNVVTESFLTPKLPYRSVHSMFDEPGQPGPTLVLTSRDPPHLVLWRPPYDDASWSDWYTEFSVAPFTDRREGHAGVYLDPPLAVVASYTAAGDAGEPLLIAVVPDGGTRVLMRGPAVGKLQPSVIATDAGTFLATFEYFPDAGPHGVYTMEFCAP